MVHQSTMRFVAVTLGKLLLFKMLSILLVFTEWFLLCFFFFFLSTSLHSVSSLGGWVVSLEDALVRSIDR